MGSILSFCCVKGFIIVLYYIPKSLALSVN